MPANGNIQNLTGLFSTNQVLEVPDFQRNYSWEPKNVEELYTDISFARRQGKDHFLGGLILLKEPLDNHSNIQVVDGQQRLTTIFLIIAQIRDRAAKLGIQQIAPAHGGNPINAIAVATDLLTIAGPNPRNRFIPHTLVANMVRDMIFAYPSAARPNIPARHFTYSLALRKSYKKIAALLEHDLKSLESDEEKLTFLYDMLQTIRFRLQVLNVQTDTQSEAHDIFMTLNSRGLPLGPADLVKSEIFKHLTRGLTGADLELKSAELTSDWKVIVDNLDSGDIDQFLRHFLVSTQDDSVTSKKVFEVISKQINGDELDYSAAKIESQVLLSELVASSGIYGQLLNGKVMHLDGAKQSLVLLAEVLDSYRIFLLAVVDPRIDLTDADRMELIRLTEVLAFRWVLTGGNAQQLEDTFQKLSIKLRDERQAAMPQLKTMFENSLPSDDKIKAEFEDTYESATFVRVVLYKLNSIRYPGAGQAVPYNPKVLHVEHIAPNKSTPDWLNVLFPNDEGIDREVEYEAAVELWGNKLLLEAKINQTVKQKDFLTKARGLDPQYSGYKNSAVMLTNEFGHNVDTWGRESISSRNKWFADSFIAVWSISPNASALKPYSQWLAEQP